MDGPPPNIGEITVDRTERGVMTDADEDGSDWRSGWQAMVDRVGEDFSDGRSRYGPDLIDVGAVRRYVEPLEWDCPLHYDEQMAADSGYAGLIEPYTSVLTFTTPAMWAPGKDPIFVVDGADAQPARSPIDVPRRGPAPRTTGYFATDLEIEFVRPPHVGERLGR